VEKLALRLFFGFDAIMVFISAFIALSIGYYAGKAFKITSERLLLYLNLSFSILGVGLLTDGLTAVYAYTSIVLKHPSAIRLILMVGNWILSIAEIVAFSLLVYVYIKQSFLSVGGFVFAPLIFKAYNPIAEMILIFLLGYITIQALTNYSIRKETNSMLVFLGFILMLISHIFFFLTSIWALSYILAHTFQLAGFLSLLTMLIRVNKKE